MSTDRPTVQDGVETPTAEAPSPARFGRRSFLRAGLGGAALLAGGGAVLKTVGRADAAEPLKVGLAATDGWISLPVASPGVAGVSPQPPFFPDEFASDEYPDLNVYAFGFRDVTVFDGDYSQIVQLQGKVQHTSPVLYRGWTSGGWKDFTVGDRIEMELWNIGLIMRPDLADGHTVHWHGFPNQIPYYDGVPETSISVPVGRSFVYEFIPNEPGTYMYHCHFEDVEHVQMGMTGSLFVRPADYSPANKTAYGAGTGSEFDREFSWLITEIDLEEHWLSSHVQQPDWTEHHPDAFLINGRTYPDTLLPTVDNIASPLSPPAPGGLARLSYQPVGSLVQGNAGEKVLIRIANLGFRSHSIELPGLPMRVVGIDAKPTHDGRDSYAQSALPGYGANAGYETGPRADSSFVTNTLDVAPGVSYDVIVELPDPGPGLAVYPLGSRGITGSGDPLGGGSMRSEIRVHPSGTLAPQTEPNF